MLLGIQRLLLAVGLAEQVHNRALRGYARRPIAKQGFTTSAGLNGRIKSGHAVSNPSATQQRNKPVNVRDTLRQRHEPHHSAVKPARQHRLLQCGELHAV
jgi:hypothetical protein